MRRTAKEPLPGVGGNDPREIEKLKSSSAWPARVAAARTLLRELQAEERYRFDSRRFVAAVAAALPNSRIVELPGQQHIAMYTAPKLFLKEVLAFVIGPT
jgi:hypothetical protein